MDADANEPDAPTLAREAVRSLAEALASRSTLHERGRRDSFRERLGLVIDLATRALAAGALDTTLAAAARVARIRAHAERAEDALHGAGQISLGAQRAPTRDACDDGWQRVAEIVAVADESARAADHGLSELDESMLRPAELRRARDAAARATRAARAARGLVDRRNHAYTFHADAGFSFGEGWYIAAAALLAGVAIQIEPNKPLTAQAERFLRDAGLGDRLQPYRSRPRANKQTTEIVARAFAADPVAAQRALRAAFLGDGPVAEPVVAWADPRLAAWRDRKKVLVWVRDGGHHAHRNSTLAELTELTERALRARLVPVLIGDAVPGGRPPAGAIDLVFFWKDPVFRGIDARRAQLQLFEHLRARHGVVGQVGVTTAGMDGPALMGLPTLYLTDESNVRMRAWVGAVPGYREVVRDATYLDRVSAALEAWAATP
jgi:hypothetical protein